MQVSLARQATTDFLTGALNRRGFFEHAAKIWRGLAAGKQTAALMVDIDHFKAVNDRHGHDTGDKVLVAVAREAPDTGLHPVGRLGGEEFALLVDSELEDALEAAEHLRQAVAGIGVQAREGAVIKPTCSIGVAEYEPGDTIDTLLRRADVALFEAKRSGRNRVVAADTCGRAEAHAEWIGATRTRARPKETAK
jgi:two-component system, cell cycle response regulator